MWHGFSAYVAAAARVPFLWPLLALGTLRPLRSTAEAVYDRVVARKHAISNLPVGTADAEPRQIAHALRPLAFIGAFLLVVNSLFGWHGTTSWPFTVYPTFMCCFAPTATVISVEFLGPDGQPVASLKVGQADPNLPIGSERLSVLVTRILLLPDAASQAMALRALIGVERENSPELGQATEVRLYRQEYDVNPDRRGDPPIQQDLIITLPLNQQP